MPPTTAFTMKSFFDRINDVDPDLRQMAVFDLHQELLKDGFVLQEEDKVMKHIIKCFTVKEGNSDVHCNVLRMLAVLIPKLEQRSRDALVDHLARSMYEPIPEGPSDRVRSVRENSAMALKGITEVLSDKHADSAEKAVRLLAGGLTNTDLKIRTEILEVLGEIVGRFGDKIGAHHQALQEAAMKDLSGDAALRKRAVNLVATLSLFTNNELYEKVMNHTINGLRSCKGDALRQHIQLCSAIARAAGSRFAHYVEQVVPMLLNELKRLAAIQDADERESPEADETRENILQAFENFCGRCPGTLSQLMEPIVSQCAELIAWDPNFCGGIDDEDDDEEVYDDDEDSSWKVRKSAARCLVQAVQARPDLLPMFIKRLLKTPVGLESGATMPLLVSRFYERVETVRLEVLDVFRYILIVKRPTDDGVSRAGSGSGSLSSGSFQHTGSLIMANEAIAELQDVLPIKDAVVHALVRSLKHKSTKVKLAVFLILQEVFLLIGSELKDSVAECAAATIDVLKNPKLALPNLRPDVLQFARTLAARSVELAQKHNDEAIIIEAEKLFPVIFACAEDRYFKTVVVALRVCKELVPVTILSSNPKSAMSLFDCLFARICTADAEQEVKRAAVDAMASLLSKQESALAKGGANLGKTYEQLVQLLQNETTRVAGARAVQKIQRCKLQADVVKRFTTELTAFLRKTDRQVREAALRTLTTFVPIHLATLDEPTLNAIVAELTSDNTSLLTDKELYLTSLALQLSRSITAAPKQAKNVARTVVPRVLSLVASPLVQGSVVSDASDLFRALVTSSEVNYNDLLNEVQGAVRKCTASNVNNVAAVVGATVANDSDAARRDKAVAEYCTMARPGSSTEAVGLVCIGEVGRHVDITTVRGAADTLNNAIAAGTNEDIKLTAAFAYGRAASGNAGRALMAKLVADVESGKPHKYFALRAVKEALVAQTQDGEAKASFVENKDKIVNIFFAHSEDEHAVDVAHEGIGRCLQLDPPLITKFARSIGSSGPGVQSCILAGLRFAVTGSRHQQVDDALKQNLATFMSYLCKSFPLNVRKASVQLISAAAYSRPNLLLLPAMNSCFANLLEETAVDPSLVSTVDLGPFKHIVDKGLELRKLAVEGLTTMVDSANKSNSVLDFVGNYAGVVDRMTTALNAPAEHDLEINQAARVILGKLAKLPAASGAVLAKMDAIATQLKTTATAKPKDGQEADKIEDANKQSIVCAIRLGTIAGATQNAKYQDMWTTIQTKAPKFLDAARLLANQE